MTNERGRRIIVDERPQVPWLSVLLGYGPMLPIVIGAILAWTGSRPLHDEALLLTAIYAGSILAFLPACAAE